MKLFVTDYDDTFYTDDKSILLNIKKLKKLKKHNFIIVIATGRCLPSIKEQIIKYHIPYDYLSCADGSIVYDTNDNIIYKSILNTEIVNYFEEFSKKMDYEHMQYVYPEGYSRSLEKDNILLGVNICIKTELSKQKDIDDFFDIKKLYPNYNYLFYKHPVHSFFCIKPLNISKAYSIDILKDKLNISKEDVFIIGDSNNDADMLQKYNGVGMKNSCPEVLEIVHKTYSSVSNYIDDILDEL